MIPDEVIDAFYESRRSPIYPLGVNDVVLVRAGRKSGDLAAVISVHSPAPEVRYLIEYGDGSDEVVPLHALELKEGAQPDDQHNAGSRPPSDDSPAPVTPSSPAPRGSS